MDPYKYRMPEVNVSSMLNIQYDVARYAPQPHVDLNGIVVIHSLRGIAGDFVVDLFYAQERLDIHRGLPAI